MSVAIVTGANKGLGFATAKALAEKDYTVIITGRNKESIMEAAHKLRQEVPESRIEPFEVDVTNQEQINYLSKYLFEHFPGEVEILVNNAGVYTELSTKDYQLFTLDPQLVLDTFSINALGAFRMTQQILPHIIDHKKGRVVNVSSGMGQLHDMGGGSAAYRISKTALNAITKIFAHEVSNYQNILVNSVCPGWVRTDMGGQNAPRSVAQGIETIVWLASSEEVTLSGSFFRDKKEIPW